MNRNIERLLVGAARRGDGNAQFINSVMRRLATPPRAATKKPQTWARLLRFRRAHGAVFALLAILAAVAVSGAAYAAVIYAPRLLHIDGTTTTTLGKQYEVKNFSACKSASTGNDNVQKFLLKPTAPQLSDSEVQKILQARCELRVMDDSIKKAWPGFGTHQTWQDGDTVYYQRADVMGTVTDISDHSVTIQPAGNATPITYHTPGGVTLQVLQDDALLSRSHAKVGDIVMVVVRASEIYHKQMPTGRPEQPKVLGAVGVLKFDLPLDYYYSKQDYLADVPPCTGNETELCPGAGGASFDLYPRGSESATNPDFKMPKEAVFREIGGTVTVITPHTVTFKTMNGTTITASINDDNFTTYNQSTYAQSTGASLNVGSRVMVYYYEPGTAHTHSIVPSQIQLMTILTDQSPKDL